LSYKAEGLDPREEGKGRAFLAAFVPGGIKV
jgi:hypothetical protein